MHEHDPLPETGDVGVVPPPLLPVNESLPIDELMRRVRAEVERRRAVLNDGVADQDAGKSRRKRLQRWSGAGAQLPIKAGYKLDELLQFWDEEFVVTAYRILLRRPADASGLKNYVEALRNGSLTKVEVLGEIRFSDEGRRQDVHVDGLLIPYKLQGLRRIPVVGHLLAFGIALARLPRLSLHMQSIASNVGRSTQELGALVNRVDEEVEQRLADIDADVEDHANAFAVLHEGVNALRDELAMVSARNDMLEARQQRLDKLEYDDFAALRVGLNESRRGLLDMQRKVMALAQGITVTSPRSGEASSSQVLDSIVDAEYVSFEDTFRGARDDIKRRAEHYLDRFEDAGVTTSSGLVLDLGCGRGEWIELLNERGYKARGVDMNPVMLEDSRQHGLDVVESDALTYLRGLPEDSIAAITSMHLVEHLPQAVLIQFLDEALRVLKPGGLLALETPNPENITVGSCWFYLDPTHRNPIPPALLQWMVANRGYEEVTIHRLKEHRGVPLLEPVSADLPGASQINEMIGWFTAAPDYAVVARKI